MKTRNTLAAAIAYAGTVAATALAATLVAGSALAETPTIDTTPFVSTRSRADVRAEVMASRDTLSAAASEWNGQRNTAQPFMSGRTRAQATAEYVATREQVHAMNAEDGGSAYLAQAPRVFGGTLMARQAAR